MEFHPTSIDIALVDNPIRAISLRNCTNLSASHIYACVCIQFSGEKKAERRQLRHAYLGLAKWRVSLGCIRGALPGSCDS